MELTDKDKEIIGLALNQVIISVKGRIMRARRENKPTSVYEYQLNMLRQTMGKFDEDNKINSYGKEKRN